MPEHLTHYMTLVSLPLFMAISSVTLVYSAGLIDLLGSQSQTPFVAAGMLIGSILFSSVASLFSFRYSFIVSFILATILSLILIHLADSNLVFSNTQIMLLFVGAASFNLPISALMTKAYLFKADPVRRFLYGVKGGVGSFIIFAAATAAYVLQGYTNLSSIVLSLQSIGFIVIMYLIFLGQKNIGRDQR